MYIYKLVRSRLVIQNFDIFAPNEMAVNLLWNKVISLLTHVSTTHNTLKYFLTTNSNEVVDN